MADPAEQSAPESPDCVSTSKGGGAAPSYLSSAEATSTHSSAAVGVVEPGHARSLTSRAHPSSCIWVAPSRDVSPSASSVTVRSGGAARRGAVGAALRTRSANFAGAYHVSGWKVTERGSTSTWTVGAPPAPPLAASATSETLTGAVGRAERARWTGAAKYAPSRSTSRWLAAYALDHMRRDGGGSVRSSLGEAAAPLSRREPLGRGSM
mmetsp:Transcript_44547/g.143403  ORF Transcript_44547/g.143403 Transcript_44547/m.143403 type:complete len:209 (-) Transcript_44547:1014-1640(-)